MRTAQVTALLAAATVVGFLAIWRSSPNTAEAKPEPAPARKTEPYVEGEKTIDGIGKYYFGREIALTMGHGAAWWLDRPDREKEEAPSALVKNLDLAPDAEIADIGAGSGFFSFMLSPKVPKGKVYAVDIQPEMLDLVNKKKAEQGITNVETVLGQADDTKLAADSIDAVLLVDAYHEFSHPREMLDSLFRALRPGGRVFLLEYRAEDPDVPIKPLHKMTLAQAKKEFEASGFEWLETRNFLPRQHFIIFRRR